MAPIYEWRKQRKLAHLWFAVSTRQTALQLRYPGQQLDWSIPLPITAARRPPATARGSEPLTRHLRSSGPSRSNCALVVEAMKVVHPGPGCEAVVATLTSPNRETRMNVHKNACLTHHGRILLVQRVGRRAGVLPMRPRPPAFPRARPTNGWQGIGRGANPCFTTGARPPPAASAQPPLIASQRSSACAVSG